VGAWNLSENLIAEKNIAGGAWEFGYAIGASRPLALAARPEPCTFCPENFVVGMEVFGGLGDMRSLGLADTSHYLGPGGRLGAPQRSDAAAVARLRPQPQQPPRPPAPRRGVRDQAPGGPVMWRATGDRAVTSRLALIASTLAVCLAASLDGRTGTTPHRRFGLAGAPAQAHGLRNPFRGEPDAVRAGRKLFVRYCATCHGEDARGRRATPALDSQRIAGAPEGDLFWFLTNGELRAGMPSWSRLPEARRWQLVTYVTTLPSQPSGAQPPN
jgi:mono/diheme cytochrome c family protein